MNRRNLIFVLNVFIISMLLSGCTAVQSFFPTETPTATATPTATQLPTSTPTPTEIPYYLTATYFSGELQVPILIYHQFFPDSFGPTTATKMQISEFKRELQSLYDNGFSLISLKSWINGTFIVPSGRKPLILTIDDLWMANQIFISESGSPSDISGLGILWKFSQEHPDFGFHAAVFAVYGDKYFAIKQVGNQFYGADNATWETESWRLKLGTTIAWAIDHGIEVYNHTLNHPNLSQLGNADIQKQLRVNDTVLRTFLTQVGREDLIPGLDNMIALPEGIWPESQSGKNIVLNYLNPEGNPVLAVMEAYNLDMAQLTPSFFSPGFNPMAIPRITASSYMVNYIVENKDMVPTGQTCQLGPLKQAQQNDPTVIIGLIQSAISTGSCSEGIYHVNENIFVARDGTVTLFHTMVNGSNGFTPTPASQ